MPTLIIENDSDDQAFSESQCDCDLCTSMNKQRNIWMTYEPKTNLQRRMKEVIMNIEDRENKKRKIK